MVVCNPFGREYLRAHRALRELAHRLSASGFHALRFDYSGSGDSSGNGDEADLGQWLEDIRAAIDEVRNLSGGERVSLVGLRLGAALALLAAARERGVARLALWDPVIVGNDYVRELLELQAAWSLAHPGLAPLAASARGSVEILGFPLTLSLREGIEAIDLLNESSVAADRVLFMSGVPTADSARFRELLLRLAPAAAFRQVPGGRFWLKGEGIHQALVPTAAIQSIADWFSEPLP